MNNLFKNLVLCLAVAVLFTSCLEDQCTRTTTFIQYDPVYIPVDEIRPGIDVTDVRELVDPGLIYVYKDYLLVNERTEGIHVFDNSDPSSPVNLGFIEIPGNRDMVVKNDVLYADLYLDLVSIDIKDPLNPSIIGRTDGVFSGFYPFHEEAGYVVEYVPTERTVEVDCNDGRWGQPWFIGANDQLFLSSDVSATSGQSVVAEVTGVGGSMARFTLAKDYLYALDDYRMRVFNIEGAMPELENTVEVDWGIETLFPYGDYLFIGANAGMFIMDNKTPTSPSLLARFEHAESCDPVFVTDDIAYVTLRGGSLCGGWNNQLDVIDVSDIDNPRLMRSYPMDHPHGLAVVDETLYLCEGQFGLKVFDVEDKMTIAGNLLDHIRNLHGFDVIALDNGNHLIVIGMDGLYQFDATDKNNLVEISRIDVNRL